MPSLGRKIVEERLSNLNIYNNDFKNFYSVCNGISWKSFQVMPLFDTNNLKKTWDCIEKNNDFKNTSYLNKDPMLLKKFFIFSKIDAFSIAVFERMSSKIFYEEDNNLHSTSLDLKSFIITMLKEIKDL